MLPEEKEEGNIEHKQSKTKRPQVVTNIISNRRFYLLDKWLSRKYAERYLMHLDSKLTEEKIKEIVGRINGLETADRGIESNKISESSPKRKKNSMRTKIKRLIKLK